MSLEDAHGLCPHFVQVQGVRSGSEDYRSDSTWLLMQTTSPHMEERDHSSTSTVSLDAALDVLAVLLRRIMQEGGDANTLRASVRDVYICMNSRKGSKSLYCEAVSNRFLGSANQLGATEVSRLLGMGFAPPLDGPNFSRRSDTETDDAVRELALEVIELFTEVYGCSSRDELLLETSLKDAEHPSNPQLCAAIETIAERESAQNWDKLYDTLLNATLLVPVEAQDPTVAETMVRFVHGKDGRLAYAAFTHYESLRAMAPEGMPYKTMSGAEFFPMVRDKSVEIVIINPAGPISAELRAKQIETLASAGLKARKGH